MPNQKCWLIDYDGQIAGCSHQPTVAAVARSLGLKLCSRDDCKNRNGVYHMHIPLDCFGRSRPSPLGQGLRRKIARLPGLGLVIWDYKPPMKESVHLLPDIWIFRGRCIS